MNDYRVRMFQSYSSKVQRLPRRFDAAEARRWVAAYDHYLRNWLPTTRAARILDIGCGGGRLLYFLLRRGFANVTGVDISAEQIGLARQITDNVVCTDAIGFLESDGDPFDLIVGLDIIEHFAKPDVFRFLDACRERLVPGGRLVLQTPNAESPWGAMHRYNDFTHEVGFNPNSLACVGEICGFERFDAREVGPVIHGLKSLVRRAGWKTIRLGLQAWNLFETGSAGSGVFTRVFLMSMIKPSCARPDHRQTTSTA